MLTAIPEVDLGIEWVSQFDILAMHTKCYFIIAPV
jgi:hypothetical protein